MDPLADFGVVTVFYSHQIVCGGGTGKVGDGCARLFVVVAPAPHVRRDKVFCPFCGTEQKKAPAWKFQGNDEEPT